nr:MAG TPA: hypothetical protein [Caudoviricetes sp.]
MTDRRPVTGSAKILSRLSQVVTPVTVPKPFYINASTDCDGQDNKIYIREKSKNKNTREIKHAYFARKGIFRNLSQ